mmetsp:Transcript_7400/g.20183  ORF Transcript_7400/g.20183 Transcript_7400/m.20183 type:complete len:102 (+) Transcript_7400:235-540(+)
MSMLATIRAAAVMQRLSSGALKPAGVAVGAQARSFVDPQRKFVEEMTKPQEKNNVQIGEKMEVECDSSVNKAKTTLRSCEQPPKLTKSMSSSNKFRDLGLF